MHLKNISLTTDGLNIEFQNGAKDCFPYLWLRDHCKDVENWDERSHQRKLFTALVDPNIQIEETKIIEDNKTVEVKWPDMSKTVHYSGDFLYKNSLVKFTTCGIEEKAQVKYLKEIKPKPGNPNKNKTSTRSCCSHLNIMF